MELLWMPFADLLDGVLSGRTPNAPLVNAVLLATCPRARRRHRAEGLGSVG